MSCYRCPHYVRHGAAQGQVITFRDLCALKLKQKAPPQEPVKRGRYRKVLVAKSEPGEEINRQDLWESCQCDHFPFPSNFQYLQCATHLNSSSSMEKNSAFPKKDNSFLEDLGPSVADMEFL